MPRAPTAAATHATDSEAETEGMGVDPDIACNACGLGNSPETMLICDCCQHGFHTACIGLSAVPDTETWWCAGCSALRSLAVGDTVVTESPQLLFKDGTTEPVYVQGLYTASVEAVGSLTHDGTDCSREVQLMSASAPAQGSIRFYSKRSPHNLLQRVPKLVTQQAESLHKLIGATSTTFTLSSSRHGMFGTA